MRETLQNPGRRGREIIMRYGRKRDAPRVVIEIVNDIISGKPGVEKAHVGSGGNSVAQPRERGRDGRGGDAYRKARVRDRSERRYQPSVRRSEKNKIGRAHV